MRKILILSFLSLMTIGLRAQRKAHRRLKVRDYSFVVGDSVPEYCRNYPGCIHEVVDGKTIYDLVVSISSVSQIPSKKPSLPVVKRPFIICIGDSLVCLDSLKSIGVERFRGIEYRVGVGNGMNPNCVADGTCGMYIIDIE